MTGNIISLITFVCLVFIFLYLDFKNENLEHENEFQQLYIQELEKELRSLKQSLEWSDERESELIDKIKELEAQIENMKNCANCGHFVCNENDKKECGYYYKDWIMRR